MIKFKQKHKRIGDMLVERGILTNSQVKEAIKIQKKTDEKIGDIFLRLDWIKEDELIEIIHLQWGIPKTNPAALHSISPAAANLISKDVANKYKVIPLSINENKLVIATTDPLNMWAMDDLFRLTGFDILPTICSRKTIKDALDGYKKTVGEKKTIQDLDDIADLDFELEKEDAETKNKVDESQLRVQADDVPVVKLGNFILARAVRDNASDIHIEPLEKSLIIRYRVDGMLFNLITPPKSMHLPLVSRIKILSGMDITERRLPQDGSFVIRIDDKRINIRASSLPLIYGEKLVLRILDSDSFESFSNIDNLGLDSFNLKLLKDHFLRPRGMYLITGPTGTGKSTTLCSMLKNIATSDKNAVTVEDPVEYRFKNIHQVEIKPEIGLDFADVLRYILRQDPDIIMIGEIRDSSTAHMAVRAALTGHVVLSTLHTNDAIGTISRLTNLGIEPFLITSCLSMAIAQRLLRKICPSCREEYSPSTETMNALGFEKKGMTFFRGKGCSQCRQTGYLGRIAIFEMLEMTPELGRLILTNAPFDIIKKKAMEAGMISLRQAGFEKAMQGITTVEEVLAVCSEDG